MLHAPTPTWEEWGTAAACAAALAIPNRPITALVIRQWAWRSRQPGDRLAGLLPSVRGKGPRTGPTLYRFQDVARVAQLTEPGLRSL
ncbi:hypothetical protein EDC02_5927 [Micromonospora sp. Llam0]|uniref:hypothetical protein n=1 Tax=Micromonospora sp. Llam0 TaxID=2485143 RepID=UPI000FBDEC56|nr:hypothetical protein [Micromonospora sp. Llam0]ROO51063.1 hypothetical protein EDC02_5927 [Micromonospora sp. Llam0]